MPAVPSALVRRGTVVIVVLVVVALLLLGLLVQPAFRSVQEIASGERPTAQQTVERARRAGENDMRTAWLRSQFRILPPQHTSADLPFIAARLAATPWVDGDLTQLRRHGQALWALRDVACRTPLHQEVEDRLDRVAAMIFDLTDEEFDTGRGQTDGQYLYHPHSDIRAAYLEGGSQGVETIMGTISAARAQARHDAATRTAAESLARERNAALRAMRETHRPTEARDAHAAWDAQARKIGQ